MITDFDDYPIHQTHLPIESTATTDRNFYDRYWFSGFDREEGFLFEIGLGVYPNRFVLDGHFSVSMGGVQHCFHTSRRAPLNRGETSSGPMRVEVVEPMRVLRVVVEANETGIECDLTFRARSAPHQEEPQRMRDGVRVIMDITRFTQFGAWEGYFSVKGERVEVKAERTPGTRDRSWGVRPVGEMEFGAPSRLTTDPSVYWVWAPIQFASGALHFATMEEPDGTPSQLAATWIPLHASETDIAGGEPIGEVKLGEPRHRIDWEKGTRRSATASLFFIREGEEVEVKLEPSVRFQMTALGYQNPEWGHGHWKDELESGEETFVLAETDPEDYSMIHVHQVVKATMGDEVGIGTLETIVFGRHAPSGFEDFFDGAK